MLKGKQLHKTHELIHKPESQKNQSSNKIKPALSTSILKVDQQNPTHNITNKLNCSHVTKPQANESNPAQSTMIQK